MFFASADACKNLNSENETILFNSALEAALLHARNLLDFFTGGPTHKDDIQAAHFITVPGVARWESNKLCLLSSHRDDLNYSISHLTYRRTNGKPQWDLPKIADEIKAAFEEFLGLLPEHEQSRWRPNQ
jgi:hypothetical protein